MQDHGGKRTTRVMSFAQNSQSFRFRDLVVHGVVTGLSFAQVGAWTHVVDAAIAETLGPVDDDVGRSVLRATAVTGFTMLACVALHRCCTRAS